MPVGNFPTGMVPSTCPSLARSLVTVPSLEFVIHTFAPSKAAPHGPLPTPKLVIRLAGYQRSKATARVFMPGPPIGPGGPVTPAGPGGPVSPAAPAGPCGPAGPASPVAPLSPGRPAGPGTPMVTSRNPAWLLLLVTESP